MSLSCQNFQFHLPNNQLYFFVAFSWAANPFYGKELDPYNVERENLMRERQREYSMARARSLSPFPRTAFEEEMDRQRNIRSTASRARSVVSYDGDYVGDYDNYATIRASRARSVSTARPLDDVDVNWEWERDREFDDLCSLASRGERERSVFAYRMALDPDPTKTLMTTTLGHGMYKNSLYGTVTWDPSTYLPGRH